MPASVKVMLSYDYCHFEICKSTDQDVTGSEIDDIRKDCMRLADKAIKQYKIAKREASDKIYRQRKVDEIRAEVERIMSKPEGDRTPNELAKVKTLQDRDWERYINDAYDYEDDWDYDDI